jgi:hypothetical protein
MTCISAIWMELASSRTGRMKVAGLLFGMERGAVGGEADAFIVKALVKETETVAAKRGRSVLDAVDFDVLAAIGISGH